MIVARPAVGALGRPLAEAFLEIDPEVLDRLAPQLVRDAWVDALGQIARVAKRFRERVRIWSVLVQRPPGDHSKLPRSVRFEKMRAAVECMNRLALRRITGEPSASGGNRKGRSIASRTPLQNRSQRRRRRNEALQLPTEPSGGLEDYREQSSWWLAETEGARLTWRV
jgi:hypothetical protein